MEVADGVQEAVVPVRDSKVPHGPALCFEAAAWDAFIGEPKAGDHRPAGPPPGHHGVHVPVCEKVIFVVALPVVARVALVRVTHRPSFWRAWKRSAVPLTYGELSAVKDTALPVLSAEVTAVS
ncbi:DUF397 domain-containing protein [Streptomyces griseorubiginosus]|uniref:DUF397 domain-containing protein n=1 Tax=Streptomyces griseorubiginosus TaxID=67304 RepID=UPI002E821E87|nr:DUF397 domain-containing protein [Streptomyces griseorubiginosus]WUB45529.1 DUF397 domain-containing protein [Streptomyces griseorubiginosus]WUB54047.1 DUF397 domain-containing protein [Streptomyces griseorubiginosus]